MPQLNIVEHMYTDGSRWCIVIDNRSKCYISFAGACDTVFRGKMRAHTHTHDVNVRLCACVMYACSQRCCGARETRSRAAGPPLEPFNRPPFGTSTATAMTAAATLCSTPPGARRYKTFRPTVLDVVVVVLAHQTTCHNISKTKYVRRRRRVSDAPPTPPPVHIQTHTHGDAGMCV